MEQQQPVTTRNERRSLSLAALIMALVALLCAFIAGWRIFSVVVSAAALIVGVFVLTKVRHAGPSKTMSVLALMVSVLAAAVSLYYLSQAVPEQSGEVPSELHDSVADSPDEATLDRLKNSMDSTQANE